MKKFVMFVFLIMFVLSETIPVQAAIKGKPTEGEVYEDTSVNELMPYIYKDNKENREEVIEKLDAISNYRVLKTKTESDYEVALAYDDGKYKYVEDTNDFDEAIEKVAELEKTYNDNTAIPSVINSYGQVVYSSNSMGRIWKHRGGSPISGETTNIYSDSLLNKAYTYINQDYIDDVPIIEDSGKSAKIQVNGYSGWIKKDLELGNYDLVVVPINQVTNPSCYIVKYGFLYHYISFDMTNSNDNYGYSIRIGVAPNYLKSGVEYYSYDGNFFYQGESRIDGLNKLITDLKSGISDNAVNYNNPLYNYYGYLPFRTKTNYTAEDLNSFIEKNTEDTSKLRGIGNALIESQNKYGVNPVLALAIAINESNWGKSQISQLKNNLFGINAVDSNPGEAANTFISPSDSVIEFSKNYISRGYADPADWRYYGGYLGNKSLGANVKYASDPFWGEKAAQHAFTIDLQLSGNSINNLTDYNGYQLVQYTGSNMVLSSNGSILYNINPTVKGFGGYAGNVAALKFGYKNNSGSYQIFADRTTNIDEGIYSGNYDWNSNGFVSNLNIKFINSPKNAFIPGYSKMDINKDDKIDLTDLSLAALNYNKMDNIYPEIDINQDGIIDLFDMVNISKYIL